MKAKQSQPAKTEEKLTTEQKVRREAIAWFWVALVFLLVNGTVGQARVIPSASMQNTLLIGDHLIMSRLGYDAGIPFTNIHKTLWRTPKRGQIVIFRPVAPGDTSDVIKRVIGLPGETIDIHDGHVYINGNILHENYTVGRTEPGAPMSFVQQATGKSTLLPFTVPLNCFFVMGDNREDSLDSRFVGPIPRDHIIGTPVMIYMSIEASSEPWGSGAIGDRISAYANALIHPSEIRWRRLFHIF
jgi:signal peptidase I